MLHKSVGPGVFPGSPDGQSGNGGFTYWDRDALELRWSPRAAVQAFLRGGIGRSSTSTGWVSTEPVGKMERSGKPVWKVTEAPETRKSVRYQEGGPWLSSLGEKNKIEVGE
ncbi:hypothetical protein NDU88_002714 [Pleurodeles waltl]|uniref:Uncharacterized protein n=1 Tax=Pleurodeles waltl TaxID=8319 RepID=A0AAV7P7F6_PLEWA|nr:hypothetical protein NDU88_002714 [Pleurodeles waltl]